MERVIGLIAGRDRTLRLHPHAARREHLRQITVNTLGTGNLRDAVTLPDGEDEREWVSMKLVDHFNDCQMVYCLVNDCCTEAACPTCTAGPSVSFRWAADGGRAQSVAAPRYFSYLFEWVGKQLNDEALLPTARGAPFPADFKPRVQTIARRLLRVYGHIYNSHYEHVRDVTKADGHLNTAFKHFLYTVHEFGLIPNLEVDLAPLQPLADRLLAGDRARWQPAAVEPTTEPREHRTYSVEHLPQLPPVGRLTDPLH